MTRRASGDRGAATIWMILGTVIVLSVCGLVFDGGALISAKRETINDAEAAARAGVQGVDVGALYAGSDGRLDPTEAASRAQAFIDANGWTGSATATVDDVTVTITRTQHLTLLTTFGLGDRTITGTATARPVQGLSTH